MDMKIGIAIVMVIGLAAVFIGLQLLILGQSVASDVVWISMTIGGFALMVIGVHLFLASILSLIRIARKSV